MAEPLINSANLWRSGAVLGEHTKYTRKDTNRSPRRPAAVGISAAAFGAHALKGRPGMTPERVASWVTAANYMVRTLYIM